MALLAEKMLEDEYLKIMRAFETRTTRKN